MVSSYDDIMGEPMDVDTHPARNKPDATQHYAGDVLPFPSSRATPIPQSVGSANAKSMDAIAKGGPKVVDPMNLAVFPRK